MHVDSHAVQSAVHMHTLSLQTLVAGSTVLSLLQMDDRLCTHTFRWANVETQSC